MAIADDVSDAQVLVSQLKSLFNEMEQPSFDFNRLAEVYAEQMVFEDSFHRLNSLADFSHYCEQLYSNVHHCHFDFHQEFLQAQQAVLLWRMNYAHPRLRKGANITVDGCSFIRFTDKIISHRDYFDGGQLLYEHVPVMGGVIRWIKNHMRQD